MYQPVPTCLNFVCGKSAIKGARTRFEFDGERATEFERLQERERGSGNRCGEVKVYSKSSVADGFLPVLCMSLSPSVCKKTIIALR